MELGNNVPLKPLLERIRGGGEGLGRPRIGLEEGE